MRRLETASQEDLKYTEITDVINSAELLEFIAKRLHNSRLGILATATEIKELTGA